MTSSIKRYTDFDGSLNQLATRRKFLTGLVMTAGSAMLVACGGGGDGTSPASVANAEANRASPKSSGSSSSSGTPTTIVNASTFGVKADGTTNDRVALQNAINGSIGKILLISGEVRIDVTGVSLLTNSYIRFAPGASIKLLAHDSDFYQVMRIWDVQNVTVQNAYIDGSKELNSATPYANSGGGGMGISITGATNVTLTSPTTIDTWGDGIYIANSYTSAATVTSNVTVTNHTSNGVRRNGATIISGSGITFTNPVWENCSGTLPSAGLDIEPNTNADVLQNISIQTPTTTNCHFGINIYAANLPGPVAKNVSIAITNHTDNGANDAGFYVSGLALNGYSVSGAISSASPTFVNSAAGYRLSDWDSAGPTVTVTNITTKS
jgi:hypothetical protein